VEGHNDELVAAAEFFIRQGYQNWGTLSPRPPGIYRFVLAPSKGGQTGGPLPARLHLDLAGRKSPDRRSGRIPALPYPPLERRHNTTA
jgi:hypothetical protein